MTPAIELVKAGKLVKAYAVTPAKRSPNCPTCPPSRKAASATIDDATWVAMLCAREDAAGDHREDQRRHVRSAEETLKSARTQQAPDYLPLGGCLAEIEAYVPSEIKKWGEVVKASGVKAATRDIGALSHDFNPWRSHER